MRIFYHLGVVVAVAMIAATPALAQNSGKGAPDPKRSVSDKEKNEEMERRQRLEETERNYKAAIKNQPDSKEKFDPWKNSR